LAILRRVDRLAHARAGHRDDAAQFLQHVFCKHQDGDIVLDDENTQSLDFVLHQLKRNPHLQEQQHASGKTGQASWCAAMSDSRH
jgi:hypothetical protein